MLSRTHFYCSLTVWHWHTRSQCDATTAAANNNNSENRVEKSSILDEEISFSK